MHFKPVPFLDLYAQYSTIKDEIQSAIVRVVESQQFILGPEVEALENALADYCQCKYAIGVSSGTDALLVSLMAIGLQPDDEVITTPYTFSSTALSIVRLGAKPIFVDIDPGTFNINTDLIEPAITPRTKAIIPVHLAGQSADMDPIMETANRHGLFVIEDACQAIGAEYKASRTGSMGHLGCFSFYPSKNLGGYGDSGLVTTNDPDLAEKIFLLRNHGQKPKYHNVIVGGNFRMDALQAAILRVKFKYLDNWTETRRNHAAVYRELFGQHGISITPDEIDTKTGIVTPKVSGFGRHIYHLYMIRTKHREKLIACLKTNQIGFEIYYPIPFHLQACLQESGYKVGDFPESEQAAKETLALPIYPELTIDMIARVVNVISEFHKSHI